MFVSRIRHLAEAAPVQVVGVQEKANTCCHIPFSFSSPGSNTRFLKAKAGINPYPGL